MDQTSFLELTTHDNREIFISIRTFFLFLLFTIAAFASQAQTDKIEQILNSKINFIEKVDTASYDNKLYLPTDFNSSQILKLDDLKKILGNVITKVELVYTTFKINGTFDQSELNRKRITALNNLVPQIIENELTEWQVVGQTGCTSAEQAREFFHGFIFTYRPVVTEETTRKELDYIEKALAIASPEKSEKKLSDKGMLMSESLAISEKTDEKYISSDSVRIFRKAKLSFKDNCVFVEDVQVTPSFISVSNSVSKYLFKQLKYPLGEWEAGIEATVKISFIVELSGEVTNVQLNEGQSKGCNEEVIRVVKTMPRWAPGRYNGKSYRTTYRLQIRFSKKACLDTLTYAYTPEGFEMDSTIFKVFKRNPQWNNMAIVCDFTGSMSPYTSQLLVWYKLNLKTNSERIKLFSFFNDGDNKPDDKKKIGKTGGIYNTRGQTFEDVMQLATKTMRAGGGGDTPENNIEALLEAIEKCPDCKDIIMIADNFATPRDLSLLSKVHKPINIILCGTYGGINTNYLDIAKATNGSLHTIEEDILNLMNLNEGEKITIDGKLYKIKHGKFVRIYKA